MTTQRRRGWIKSRNLHHYFNVGQSISLCTHTELKFNKIRNFKVRYISDSNLTKNTPLCSECKRLKNILFEKENKCIRESTTPKWELQNRICSEPGCNEKGVAYVSTTHEEKPHYCIKHNSMVVKN